MYCDKLTDTHRSEIIKYLDERQHIVNNGTSANNKENEHIFPCSWAIKNTRSGVDTCFCSERLKQNQIEEQRILKLIKLYKRIMYIN